MSSRVTRSSARFAADPPAAAANSTKPPTQPSTTSKKRKAPARPDSSPIQTSTEPTPQSSSRRSKRRKVAETPPDPSPSAPPLRASRRRGAVTEPAMSNTGYAMQDLHQGVGLSDYRTSSKHTEESSAAPQATKSVSKRPSSRSKKSQGTIKAPPSEAFLTNTRLQKPRRRHRHQLLDARRGDPRRKKRILLLKTKIPLPSPSRPRRRHLRQWSPARVTMPKVLGTWTWTVQMIPSRRASLAVAEGLPWASQAPFEL